MKRGWLVLAGVISGCCAHRGRDAAVARARALEASVVADRNPSAPPTSECDGVPIVDFDDLAHDRHTGERVAIDAEPIVDAWRTCTEVLCTDDCGDETPCCNDCEGNYRLLPPEPQRVHVVLHGATMRCGGPSCAMQCEPFGTHPRRKYRFVGVVVSPSSGGIRFDVERWCAAPKDESVPSSNGCCGG